MTDLFQPHTFQGQSGVIGGNCRKCTYPMAAPWHWNVSVEEQNEEVEGTRNPVTESELTNLLEKMQGINPQGLAFFLTNRYEIYEKT